MTYGTSPAFGNHFLDFSKPGSHTGVLRDIEGVACE